MVLYMNNDKHLIGKRIRLIQMNEEKHPVQEGTMGTITHVGWDVINVRWDNGRNLGVIIGVDRYEIIENHEPLPPNNFLVFSGNI